MISLNKCNLEGSLALYLAGGKSIIVVGVEQTFKHKFSILRIRHFDFEITSMIEYLSDHILATTSNGSLVIMTKQTL